MKLAILDKSAKKVGDYDIALEGEIREDIFKKAYVSESSLFRQEKGADPLAGKRHAINLSKRRRNFRTTYGRGMARTPRKVMWARGRQMRYVGAFAPNTVGGRKAHAPKASKILLKGVNNKEWLRAMQIGVLASMTSEIVVANGGRVPQNYPFVLDDSVESISKTKEFNDLLDKFGLSEEVDRLSVRKVRAGKGTMRNRTYKTKRGPLVVVSSLESPLLKASRNVRGFEVVTPEVLMVSDFGMSEKPGRMVMFTKSALEQFNEVFN